MTIDVPPRNTLPVPSLREALRRARSEAAERSGVIVELRTAELARLDLLKDALHPILEQVPNEIDMFDAAILPGEPARLFIDSLGFVEMGRDKRTYQFFQDTRYGRRLIAESDRLDDMVVRITDYIARRLVEREKALSGDTLGEAGTIIAAAPPPAANDDHRDEAAAPRAESQEGGQQRRRGSLWLLFLIGVIFAFLGFWGAGKLIPLIGLR